MHKETEWTQVAAETVNVGDGVIREANGANYTCTEVKLAGDWVAVSGGIQVGNPDERQRYTQYTESYRRQELVWCLRRS